ncbi:MAG: FAD:protein FMN transferase, partial [Fimbriimonadales bacterium]|nr:FAD:protein FMN transferase [Fimbriimonadales bacterium]
FSWQAMGTEYQLHLVEADSTRAEAIAESLREEVKRLERQLSLYQPDSDLCYLNAYAAKEPVRVEPGLFQLLQTCKMLWEQTEGAFDPTITPLLRLWGFVERRYRVPSPDEVAEALERVGMEWVLLEPEGRWVYYAREGIELSFGAIGKGWAVARGVRLLEQFGVAAALLSAGGSTLYAQGAPPDSEGWAVEIPHPEDATSPAEVVLLRDSAFSTSGGTEQFFEVDGRRYAHILDPRTGYPADKLLSVSVCAPDPTLTDALSTAFFVGGQSLIARWQHQHPDLRIWHFA